MKLFWSAMICLPLLSCGGSSSGGDRAQRPPASHHCNALCSVEFASSSSQHMRVGTPSELAFVPNADEFTVSGWYRSVSSGVGQGTIISKALGSPRQVFLGVGGSGNLEGTVGDIFRSSNVNVVDGQWHHVALVNKNVSGTFMFELFVDGVASGAQFASGSATVVADWLIGARRGVNNNDTGFLLNGFLDEIAIWRVGLTDSEVAAISSGGRTMNLNQASTGYNQQAELISWWRLGESSDDDIVSQFRDQKGNNHTTNFNFTRTSQRENF